MDRLVLRNVEDMPLSQQLETPIHVKRKRVWQPSPASLRPTASISREAASGSEATSGSAATSSTSHLCTTSHGWLMEVLVEEEPMELQGGCEESRADSPTPSSRLESSSPYSVPSPALYLKHECASPPLQSPQSPPALPRHNRRFSDHKIDDDINNGSEGSDSSDGDEEFLMPPFIPRVFRAEMETPLDLGFGELEDPVGDAAAAPSGGDVKEVPLTATDQPWRWYDFEWREFPTAPVAPAMRRETFSQNNVGPTTPCVDPYEIFVSIWDRQFMEHIAFETNRYAQQLASHLLDTNDLLPNSRIGRWKDTTADELYIYFAVTLAMGVLVKSRIDEYWVGSSDIFHTPGFSAHISYNRYSLLSRCLHFNDNKGLCALDLDSSEAKLYKIKPVLLHLNSRFASLYTPKQNIALDESLLLWKGWLDIKQFIPHKSAAVGIKTYELCESQTGYLWRFEVHTRRNSPSPPQQLEDPVAASTPSIVLRLISGLENKGYTLWMDSFYNSPCLARRLKALGTDCVGTLRTNRKFVPQDLHNLTIWNMRPGEITGLTSGDVDVMLWRDSNRVAMLSTYHGMGVGTDGQSTKPILILDYNIMMGGVDKKDQLMAMYPIERKRNKVWYKKFFKRLLNVSVLNSYVIHNQSAPLLHAQSLTHRKFRMSLINSLLAKHTTRPIPPAPREAPAAAARAAPGAPGPAQFDIAVHRLATFPVVGKQRQRRVCVVCKKRVGTYCFGCEKAACMEPCFLLLHS